MGRFFDRLLGRTAVPLTGAPATPREKTYAAQTGFVYQYHYAGHRRAAHGPPGAEYVFEISAGPSRGLSVSVIVEDEAVEQWERAHRPLSSSEHYAIAKMALFQAFDDRTAPASMKHPVRARAADVIAILENLGVD